MIVLSLIGTASIAAFGLMLFRIASGHWWCRYGREALFCAAFFQLTFITLRLMVEPMDILSPESSHVLGGFMAIGFTGILTQIILIHRVVHKGEHREHTNIRTQTRC